VNVSGTTTLAATNNGAPADVTLDNATNNFGGTVNVSGANVTLVDGTGGLTLGNVTATGNLTTTSTGGAITDAAGSTVNVSGTTTLAATNNGAPADVTLDNATNNFAGTVNASGANVTLVDGTGGLTLGNITAPGDVLVASLGALNLGTSTIGGTLQASSGGGNITQSGPLLVGGMATLDAGTGVVKLTNASNQMTSGTTVLASSYTIEGDARKAAADLASKTQSSAPTTTSPGLTLTNAAAPQPLTMVNEAAAASSGSSSASSTSSSSASGAVTGGGSSAGVTVDLRNGPSTSTSVMAAVSLPKGMATSGTGFSFELPETVRTLAEQTPQTTTQASLPDGAPLPTWLKFDAQRLRFDATAVPDGAFPLQVVMNVGQQRVLVVISERTE